LYIRLTVVQGFAVVIDKPSGCTSERLAKQVRVAALEITITHG
jgi:hypothetical protein